MSWKDIEKGSGSNDFIKIKDGEAVEVVFIGDPITGYKIFKDRKWYTEEVAGSSFKFRVNVATKEGNGYAGKILEGGFYLGSDIKENIEENGQESVYKIKRNGTGTDTRYTVMFKKKLKDEQYGEFLKMSYPALLPVGKKGVEEEPPVPDEEDIPF